MTKGTRISIPADAERGVHRERLPLKYQIALVTAFDRLLTTLGEGIAMRVETLTVRARILLQPLQYEFIVRTVLAIGLDEGDDKKEITMEFHCPVNTADKRTIPAFMRSMHDGLAHRIRYTVLHHADAQMDHYRDLLEKAELIPKTQ